MAEFTRPATWEDVKRVARYLEEAGAQYALIGGYALAAHGLVRLTEDIDILVDPAAANSRRWIVALSRLPDGAAREHPVRMIERHAECRARAAVVAGDAEFLEAELAHDLDLVLRPRAHRRW